METRIHEWAGKGGDGPSIRVFVIEFVDGFCLAPKLKYAQ